VPRLNGFAAIWAAATTVAAPGLRLALRLRLARGKEAPGRLHERRGIDVRPRPAGRLIWLHAASVGETISILPVLAALAEAAPDATLLLTTGTVTSAELFTRRLPELGLRCRVLHRFAPLDVPAWVRQFLDHWRPDAVGFVESEFWPNQLAACRMRGIPVMLINARLSDRSLARWRRVPGLARQVLGGFSRVHARSETDAARLREFGCHSVTAPGDLKLAALPLPVDAAELQRLRTMLTGRPMWLAASTHPGEEALIFAVHRALAADHPGLLTIIAPRHPERGAAIAAYAGSVPVSRRGIGGAPPTQGVWIVDTLGELGLWYRLAGITFVGRSLIPPGGGQNPLEPARLGCAIAVGPHTGNFTDHVEMLHAAGGLAIVKDAADLTRWINALLRDPVGCRSMADAAAASVRRHGDLPRRTAAALLELLPASRT
jgi:3-deoxy-D-manno-octulosonic-acid transferase